MESRLSRAKKADVLRPAVEPRLELIEPPVDARILQFAIVVSPDVVRDFRLERGSKVLDLVAPVKSFDNLFRAKRDQNTDDDYPDFADKFPPAMERLG